MLGLKDLVDEDKLAKGMAEVVIPSLAKAARELLDRALAWAEGVSVTVALNPKTEPPREQR